MSLDLKPQLAVISVPFYHGLDSYVITGRGYTTNLILVLN